MAVEVGTAYVSIIPSARGFARRLKQDIAKEFAGADLDRLVSNAMAGSRSTVRVPVAVDADRLHTEVARAASTAQGQTTVRVPVEPGDRRAFQTRLQAMVSAAQRHVRAEVEVDVDRSRLGGATSLIGGLAGAASSLAGMASGALSSLTGLAAAVAALGTVAAFAVPSVHLIGGAIGALPAIAASALAAISALAIGMIGISDAFKDVGGGGGGGGAGADLAAQARQVAQATRGVESAQRSLARAQREVLKAQQDVTRARREEAERLQDLDRALRGARLSEEEAALRVLETQRELNEARASGNIPDIQRAELAYRQALLGVEDARDATQDLQAEKAEADKKGVEGSDAVRDALDRQRDAIDGVKEATNQLKSAQEALQAAQKQPSSGGGGGGGGLDLPKLAPSAERFVAAVKALKPAFEALRLNVQQRLFAGLDQSVRRLATAWFPQLNKTLGAYASTFNGFAKDVVRTITQKSFIDNIAVGAEAGRKALERMGEAVSGPLLNAFGKLSRAAAPFIKAVGDAVAGLIEDFATWIDQLDKSGALDKFFTRAGEVFQDLIDMGKDLASIFGSVMSILFGVSEDTTKSPWESLRDSLDKVAKWLKDPQNQQKVREWITDIKDFAAKALEAANKIQSFVNVLSGWGKKIETVKEFFTGLKNRITEFLTETGEKIRAFPGKVAAFLAGLPAQVGKLFSSVFSRAGYVIGYGVGVVLRWFATLPGKVWAFVRQVPTRISMAVTAAVNLLRTLPQRAANAIATIGARIGAVVRGIPGRLYNAGRDMVIGLVNGVTSLGGWLYSAMSGFAANAVQGFKDALGIASPSKVMADQVGRWIPAGIAVGIEANASDVTDAIDGIIPSTIGAPAAPSTTMSGGGLEVGWRAGSTGDPLLDALRQLISIRYRGDAVAALSGR